MNNYEVIGKWIYFSYTNNGKSIISKVKVNGESFTKIDDDASNLFYIKNNTIYYIYKNQEGSYEFYKIKTNGKDKEKIADLTGEIQLDSINFDGNSLYYVKKDENDIINIYNIKLNGEGEREIVEIKDYNTIINVHNGWVYYTDINENGDSQMYKVRLNGKDKQSL